MARGRFGLVALLLTLCAAGCAITPNSDVAQFAVRSGANSFEIVDRQVTSPQALVLPVVHDRQYAGPACGAHALASIVNYWRGPGTLDGATLFASTPPTSPMGYSMAELMALARAHGLAASAVRLNQANVIRELESGRPVLVPVNVPSIYVQKRVFPGADVPVIGLVRNAVIYRASRVSEWTDLAMVDHYLVVVGYDEDRFIVVEPVMGYRTIAASRLARYREAFDDAAIVFSGPPRRTSSSAATS
jgi:predicted double-glycine peptidase